MGLFDSFFGGGPLKAVKKKAAESLKVTDDAATQIRQTKGAEMEAQYLDPASSNYKGPGWDVKYDTRTGQPRLEQTKDPTRLMQQADYERSKQPKTAAGVSQMQTAAQGADFFGTGPATVTQPSAADAAANAPTINREKIDKLLGGLDTYQNDIYQMSKDNTGLSAAQAELEKGRKLANFQAQTGLGQSQAAALGQARSARSRADRGLLERGAVGEAAYLGQEAQRQGVQRAAEFEGSQAKLRADEANADRDFKLRALESASQLGLNTAALETDLSKADLGSANEWINNQFQQMGIDKQLNAQETQNMLGYMKDMAALQFQYDQLDENSKQAADALIMQKYGIDQQTAVALKGIKEQNKFKWGDLLTGVVGAAGSGLTGGIANLIGGKKQGG